MVFQTVQLDGRGYLALVTLRRPDVGNKVSLALAQELQGLCQALEEDDETRVVIVTGAGEAFCRGEEPAELLAGASREGWRSPAALACGALASLTVPVIAAINGDALGAGLELALACDLRVASETARFALSQTAWGLIPSGGATQRLPRLVGRGKALEMLLLGETIESPEAYRIGLVNRLTPPFQVLAEAESMAQRILERGPVAERYGKEAVLKGLDLTLEQGLRLEADLSILLQTTRDRDEGIRAFLEKRAPQFKGE